MGGVWHILLRSHCAVGRGSAREPVTRKRPSTARTLIELRRHIGRRNGVRAVRRWRHHFQQTLLIFGMIPTPRFVRPAFIAFRTMFFQKQFQVTETGEIW